MKLTDRLMIGVAIAFAAALFAEGAALLARATEIPIFKTDPEIGYLPKPNQEGDFLWTNRWSFNELGMGTPKPFSPTPDKVDVLLVGDSIVFGGNSYREGDRLGPQLEKATGWTVWPIGAGGWSNQNELAWLLRHPRVVQSVDRIIVIVDQGDFDEPANWRSDLEHPLDAPFPRALYLLRRTLLPRLPASPPHPIAEWPDVRERFDAWVASVGKPVDVVIYPSKKALMERDPCAATVSDAPETWHCVTDDPRWNASMYKDNIHPTPAANAVLASVIKRTLP